MAHPAHSDLGFGFGRIAAATGPPLFKAAGARPAPPTFRAVSYRDCAGAARRAPVHRAERSKRRRVARSGARLRLVVGVVAVLRGAVLFQDGAVTPLELLA